MTIVSYVGQRVKKTPLFYNSLHHFILSVFSITSLRSCEQVFEMTAALGFGHKEANT